MLRALHKSYSQSWERSLKNFSWLFLDRVLAIALGLWISIIVARALTPSDFGALNLAIAYIAIFTPIAALGLEPVLLKELSDKTYPTGLILGSSILMRLVGSVFSILITIIGSFILNNEAIVGLISILCLRLFFQVFDIFEIFLKSRLNSKYSVFVRSTTLLIFSLIKLVWASSGGTVNQLAWILVAESVFIATGLLIVAYYLKALHGLKVSFWSIRYLYAKSWTLIISDLLVIAFFKIDQLMLGALGDGYTVGIYTVALKLIEFAAFLPQIFVQSIFPKMAELKVANRVKDLIAFNTMRILNGVCYLLIAVTFLIGQWGVTLLYGDKYAESAQVLKLLIIGTIFTFCGVVRGYWMLLNNLQKYHIHSAILGILVLIPLNFILIPKYGAEGAAVSTVFAYFASVHLSSWLFFPLRKFAKMQFFATLLMSSKYV